jgi:hypothetical protein
MNITGASKSFQRLGIAFSDDVDSRLTSSGAGPISTLSHFMIQNPLGCGVRRWRGGQIGRRQKAPAIPWFWGRVTGLFLLREKSARMRFSGPPPRPSQPISPNATRVIGCPFQGPGAAPRLLGRSSAFKGREPTPIIRKYNQKSATRQHSALTEAKAPAQ